MIVEWVSAFVVHQKPTDGVKQFMRSETLIHVPPIRLWQALCGGAELPKGEYQHIIECLACETLATQIGDALDYIEAALRRNNIGTPGANGTSRLN